MPNIVARTGAAVIEFWGLWGAGVGMRARMAVRTMGMGSGFGGFRGMGEWIERGWRPALPNDEWMPRNCTGMREGRELPV